MNYSEARRKLIDARKGYPRVSLKLDNNTWLERRDDKTIAVRYHETDIVTFTPQYIELDSGGWHTMSTASRMRDSVPGWIGSDKGGWAWYPLTDDGAVDWQSGGHPYFDGMRIHPSGKRLMATQPHRPSSYAPVKTVSGWSGTARGRRLHDPYWTGPEAVRSAYSGSQGAL